VVVLLQSGKRAKLLVGIFPRKLNTNSNDGKLNLNIDYIFNCSPKSTDTSTWKTVITDKVFKGTSQLV